MEKHTSKRDLRKNAHTASNKPSEAPNSNSFHTKKRFPKNRENASIAVIFFQKNALALKNSPKNTYIFSAFEVSRPYHVKSIEKFDAVFYQEIMLSSGVFRRERRAVFILGAMWGALVRGWRRDCVVSGMETRFQWRKTHSHTAKCEAFHIAPRLFFRFLFFTPFTIPQ